MPKNTNEKITAIQNHINQVPEEFIHDFYPQSHRKLWEAIVNFANNPESKNSEQLSESLDKLIDNFTKLYIFKIIEVYNNQEYEELSIPKDYLYNEINKLNNIVSSPLDSSVLDKYIDPEFDVRPFDTNKFLGKLYQDFKNLLPAPKPLTLNERIDKINNLIKYIQLPDLRNKYGVNLSNAFNSKSFKVWEKILELSKSPELQNYPEVSEEIRKVIDSFIELQIEKLINRYNRGNITRNAESLLFDCMKKFNQFKSEPLDLSKKIGWDVEPNQYHGIGRNFSTLESYVDNLSDLIKDKSKNMKPG